jgi:ABC-2 type transport system ATP-binding protein
MMSEPAIQVQQLQKGFGEIKAVQGISFDIAQGEIFSLLGPNGAGKTTTISMLSTLLRPDSGDALVMGHSIRSDPMGVKSVLGVVPQEIALYEDLSARENLMFWGRMYGLRRKMLRSRVDEVLEIIGLTDRAQDRVGKYSGGMKRRVNIGIALLHKPQVIYMDEPTVGIDPQSRRNILDSVLTLKDQGMTVLYTTHYMEEAQQLSDHVAIMDHGELIALGTNAELVQIVGQMSRIMLTISPVGQKILDRWQTVSGVQKITLEDGIYTVLVDDSHQVLPRLFDEASLMGTRITSVDIQDPNLETVSIPDLAPVP